MRSFLQYYFYPIHSLVYARFTIRSGIYSITCWYVTDFITIHVINSINSLVPPLLYSAHWAEYLRFYTRRFSNATRPFTTVAKGSSYVLIIVHVNSRFQFTYTIFHRSSWRVRSIHTCYDAISLGHTMISITPYYSHQFLYYLW